MAKHKPRPRHDVWLIEWTDAFDGPAEWTPLGNATGEPRVVQSVGFLVPGAPPGHVCLVTSDDGAEHVGGGIVIPEAVILTRHRLS